MPPVRAVAAWPDPVPCVAALGESLGAATSLLVSRLGTLRRVVDSVLASMVGYLRAARDNFDTTYALEPVVDNIRKLADQ